MGRKRAGVALVAFACLLAVLAVGWWRWDSSQRDERQSAADARAVFAGRPPEDVEVNRTGPLAAAGASAVLFLSGVILIAVSPLPRSDA